MELWHVLNRGVDKRDIVKSDKDRIRFIHNLYAFNDSNVVTHISQPARRDASTRYMRKQLVHVHAFCLMNNHYHLLLSQIQENGISNYMRKINMGYAKYFNEKYSRTGALWQGKYKKVLIKRDPQFMYIPFYIHLNPLDFVMPEWRQGKIKKTRDALRHLENYRWSSHLDYAGKKNFPSIIRKDVIRDIVGAPARYEKELTDIVSDPILAANSTIIEK